MENLKKDLADALTHYRSIVHTASIPDVRAASQKVREAQMQIANEIAAGALPCPLCKGPPFGMEQPRLPEGVMTEYEIGCTACPAYVYREKDGTVRATAARGGFLPSHCADAWNAGPSMWKIKSYNPRSHTPEAWQEYIASLPRIAL